MKTLLRPLMHRCRSCGKQISIASSDDLPTCLCGGSFAVDATYHPEVGGAFHFTRPAGAPRCDRCAGMHETDDCQMPTLEEARADAQRARDELEAKPTNGHNGHNGHHYGDL